MFKGFLLNICIICSMVCIAFKVLDWYNPYMDFVAVTDEKIKKELQEEGICEPEYYYIPESGVFAEPVKLCIWKEIYKHLMGKLPEYEKIQIPAQMKKMQQQSF